MAQLHEPLVADLARGVVLVELLIEADNGFVLGDCLLQFRLVLLLLFEQFPVALLGKQIGKSAFVPPQHLRHPPKLQRHHLLDSVRPDIVPSGTASPVVHGVVGAHEIMNVLVYRLRVIPHLFVAIPAVQQVAEDALHSVFWRGRSAFGFGDPLLHLFKVCPLNDRFVNVFEHRPVFWVVFQPCFVFEGLGVGLEIDDVAAVFLLCQNLLHGGGCILKK